MARGAPSPLNRVRGRWRRFSVAHPGLPRLILAWRQMGERNGTLYAGAITFFSFLALFPLILLGVAVTGYVLHSHPAAQQSLFDHITSNVPGQLGSTLRTSINSAIKARAALGLVGLFGVLLTGLGWIQNLRNAIDAMWGRRPAKRNFLAQKLSDLSLLVGLSIALLIAIGLSTAGTSITDKILRVAGLEHVAGLHLVIKIVSIALAVLGNMVIFGWLLLRLPRAQVPRSVAIKGTLGAAVGFEVLNTLGTVLITHTTKSATTGPFTSVIAILVWIQLVSRMMMLCACWMSVRTAAAAPAPPPAPAPVRGEPSVPPPRVSRSAWFGLGALAGWAAAGLAGRRRAGAEPIGPADSPTRGRARRRTAL